MEFALPPNGKCDKHGLTFKVPATVRNNCTDEETARATTCSKAGQSYLDGLLRDNTCKQKHKNTTDLALITCAVNGKRRDSFCFSLFQSGAYSRATMKLNSNCAQEINSTSASCSKICRDTLNETKAELDCCVNIFNGTGIDTNLPGTSNIPRTSPALAYRIWESCGVETPGFCDNKLSGAIPTTYSVQWFSTLMATVAMVTVSMFSMGI